MRILLLVLGGCLGLDEAPARGADVVASIRPDGREIRLSQSVQITLTVEGDQPLRVILPEELLTEESAAVWRIRPIGPATVTDQGGGRQRWTRAYRLDPYQPGEFQLALTPAQVLTGQDPRPAEVRWETIPVRVVPPRNGGSGPIRPPTGIEELPPTPRERHPAREGAGWVLLVAVVGMLIVVVLLGRRRPRPPLTPEQRAAARLAELTREGDTPRLAEQLSEILRHQVEARFSLPATTLTTAELQRELEQCDAWSPERVRALMELLSWCDRVKFAGHRPGAEERTEALARARNLVQGPS